MQFVFKFTSCHYAREKWKFPISGLLDRKNVWGKDTFCRSAIRHLNTTAVFLTGGKKNSVWSSFRSKAHCHFSWLLHSQPKADDIQVGDSFTVMGSLPAKHVSDIHFTVFCRRKRSTWRIPCRHGNRRLDWSQPPSTLPYLLTYLLHGAESFLRS
jgi:hypothetical protein